MSRGPCAAVGVAISLSRWRQSALCASYLRSIEVQADVGETKEQPQPLDHSGHQQELVCLESPPWCVSHILIQGLDPFHLHSLDAGKMKTQPKGYLVGEIVLFPAKNERNAKRSGSIRKSTEVPGPEIRGN